MLLKGGKGSRGEDEDGREGSRCLGGRDELRLYDFRAHRRDQGSFRIALPRCRAQNGHRNISGCTRRPLQGYTPPQRTEMAASLAGTWAFLTREIECSSLHVPRAPSKQQTDPGARHTPLSVRPRPGSMSGGSGRRVATRTRALRGALDLTGILGVAAAAGTILYWRSFTYCPDSDAPSDGCTAI